MKGEKPRAALVEDGAFLPTVRRHVGCITRFTEEDTSEIRFVTEDGREFHPISSYEHQGIVFVDIEPVKYAGGDQ